MPLGPRIYNLFPLLAGPMQWWKEHLARITRMHFDWVYVNPFHYPGFSGSLYAIKDPYELHPILRDDQPGPAGDILRTFTAAAHEHGLRLMMDLVVNHTSKDALLVEQHPDWFVREANGALRSPRAVDPSDPRKTTVWGDLAELDYSRPDLRQAQVEYWASYIRTHLALGFDGFRCDAAYQVPADFWQALIREARTVRPDCVFVAETLGCTPDQVLALRGAGFDFLFNSSKWWDFRGDWLLEQYRLYQQVAPTIAFPESHDTERLASELRTDDREILERQYRLRYLFAAAFSTGVMMPMGYEYAFRKRLHVVESRPGDWQWEAARPRIDLTEFIAAANEMKASVPALNVEGQQRLATAPHGRVVGLVRFDRLDERIADSAAIVLVNPDWNHEHGIDPGPLLGATGGRFDGFTDVTPMAEPLGFEPGQPVTLSPLDIRIFRGEAVRHRVYPTPAPDVSQRRMDELAANRVAIERVYPEIDGGRHPVKRVIGDVVDVWADIFCDGHDKIAAAVKYRLAGERDWREAPMTFVDNDRWHGRFALDRIGRWEYVIEGWRDLYASWRDEISKKRDAGHDVALELIEGRHLIEQAAAQAEAPHSHAFAEAISRIEAAADSDLFGALMSEEVSRLMQAAGPRTNLSRYPQTLEVIADRTAARFAAWYELFPRSQSGDPNRHGTFDDVIRRLPYVRDMGFDVLYFTPIHPIGRTNRKGRNNSLTAAPGDPGSPYAIGGPEGGHDALHPELGTFEDFARLVEAAHEHGLEIALDFAIQCSPDHPWLKEHPEWFDWRPDGTIKYAENPPKKYEDIVNVHFYRDAYPALWYALRDVVLFWVDKGIKTFRVDNPHTKPLPFWEWMIREVQDRHPDVIFLSEAFTRPKMMKRLAKIGFTQSYTYFTWRNHKNEIIEYLTELTQDEPREYYRPNFFTNTPDINPVYLQSGRRGAFIVRGLLAATLSSVYGIYSGFELCEGTPIPGKEEYLNSEKYELKAWDYDRPGNIRDFLTKLNRIRRDNPALHDWRNVRFYNAWNDNILVYGKSTPAKDNFLLFAVNLDQDHPHGCTFEVPLWEFNLPDNGRVEVEDLLTGSRFVWDGKIQEVWLDPAVNPCAIWRIRPPGL